MEIVIIVIILLVFCCSTSIAGGIFYFSTLEDEETTTTVATSSSSSTLAPVPAPSSSPEQIVQFHLKNRNANKCLDADTSSGNVKIYDCIDAGPQQWTYDQSTKELKVKSTGKCLDVVGESSDNGANIQVWDCNGSNAQKWAPSGNTFKNVNGKCLDVHLAGTHNGANVWQHECVENNPAQDFHMYDING